MESTMSFEVEKPMDLTNNPPRGHFKDTNGDCFRVTPRDPANTSGNRICVESGTPNNGPPDCYPIEPVADSNCQESFGYPDRHKKGKV